MNKPAGPTTSIPNPLNLTDFTDAARGFIAALSDPVIRTTSGTPVWDSLTPCTLPANRNRAADREPKPLAHGPPERHAPRPVPGHRPRLSGSWPRPRQPDHRRIPHRHHRH